MARMGADPGSSGMKAEVLMSFDVRAPQTTHCMILGRGISRYFLTDIEIAIADKSLELSKHLASLDTTLKSLRSLKPALPAYYSSSMLKLEEKMCELMMKAEENVAFFTSIEEIRNDVSIHVYLGAEDGQKG